VKQARERYLADHGNGCGLEELRNLGAGERRPDDHAPVVVDDQS
jgi:hypothetical protein